MSCTGISERHARSSVTADLQVRANIVNRPLMAMQTPEAPALGAAISAGVGAGIYESAEVSKELVKVRNSAVPNDPVAEQYQERLDAYESIYSHVRALYHSGARSIRSMCCPSAPKTMCAPENIVAMCDEARRAGAYLSNPSRALHTQSARSGESVV